MDTLPNINRFFALVSQHERQLNTDNDLTVSIGSTIANSTISSKQNISDQVKRGLYSPTVVYKDIQFKNVTRKVWVSSRL